MDFSRWVGQWRQGQIWSVLQQNQEQAAAWDEDEKDCANKFPGVCQFVAKCRREWPTYATEEELQEKCMEIFLDVYRGVVAESLLVDRPAVTPGTSMEVSMVRVRLGQRVPFSDAGKHQQWVRISLASIPSEEEYTSVQSCVADVSRVIRQVAPMGHLQLYGSRARGLALAGSNVDLVLHGVHVLDQDASGEKKRDEAFKLLYGLNDQLKGKGVFRGQPKAMLKADVPIIAGTLINEIGVGISFRRQGKAEAADQLQASPRSMKEHPFSSF